MKKGTRVSWLAAIALTFTIVCASCRFNSSGWPVIPFMHNGVPVSSYNKDELRRNARLELDVALNYRDDHIYDLAEVGKSLVTHFGHNLAWSTVLDCWCDLTKGEPVEKASDVLWLQDKGAHVQSVAWLIANRTEWNF